MLKKLAVVVLVCLGACSLFALRIQDAFLALTDLVVMATVAEDNLPGMNRYLDSQTKLPVRISCMRADLRTALNALKPKESVTSYLTRLLSKPSSASYNTPAALAYYGLNSSRDYEEGDIIITGSMLFIFEGSLDFDMLVALSLKGSVKTDAKVLASVDMSFDGESFDEHLNVRGTFNIGLTDEGLLEIAYPDGFKINDKQVNSGRMLFSF